MVPLETRIVGEDSGGSEQERGTPQLAVLRLGSEQYCRQTDAVVSELPRCGLFDQEVAAIRHELLDFRMHSRDEIGRACREGDDDGFGIFATQPEVESLQPGNSGPDQWNSMLTTSPAVPKRLSGFGL